MLLSTTVVVLFFVQLESLSALPFPEPYDDGKYRPMPGENGPLPGADGDNGMWNPYKYDKITKRPGSNVQPPSKTVTEGKPDSSSDDEVKASTENPESIPGNWGVPSETEKEENSASSSDDEGEAMTETSEEHSQNDTEGNAESNSVIVGETSTENDAAETEEANGESPKSANDKGNKVVCYFEDWAGSRPGKGKFGEDEMLTAPCTHVIYSFAVLDAGSNKLTYAFTPTAIQKLKEKGVKVMLAGGGANDSHGPKWSNMASSPENRKVFINSVMELMKQHDFDGFDVDWEYPTCQAGTDSCGGSPQDKQNFVDLIRELRKAMPGKLLTMASHAGQNVVDKAYDLPALQENLDWINVMTYDLHGSWEKEALNHSPLRANEGLSTESAVKLYKGAGVPAEKIVIGMPLYGRTLRLADQSQHDYKAAVTGAGDAGPYTGEAGILSYLEICEKVKDSGWKVAGATDDVGPHAYNGDQFVSFDDVKMAEKKAKYAKEQGLGGVMVWSLGSEDFANSCGCGQYPLVTALRKVLVEDAEVSECSL